MKKIALIIFDKQEEEVGLLEKIKHQLARLSVNLNTKICEKNIDDYILLTIIKLPDYVGCKNLSKRFIKAVEYLVENNICIATISKEILLRLGGYAEEALKKYDIVSPSGEILTAALVAHNIPKLLKSRMSDIGKVDAAIISGGNFNIDMLYIKKLSGFVKCISYFCDKGTNVEKILDDIFNNSGCCIRVNESYTKGLGDNNLILNLGSGDKFLTVSKLGKSVLVYSPHSNLDVYKSNITILKSFKIDTGTKLLNEGKLEANDEIVLCEMYILAKLDMISCNIAYQNDNLLNDIYSCFKDSGFRIGSIDGANI